ncbi:MAG: hypothetical protein LBN24_10630 [Mediterranea sp.]|nr:hypothetical protein [Mediterranea sp.]
MVQNKKVKTAFVLAIYILVTITIYAIVCHFIHREFGELELAYAALIGCIAYMPRFIAEKKATKKHPQDGKGKQG